MERSGTVIETDEDIRRALLSGPANRQETVAIERPTAPAGPTQKGPAPGRSTVLFRPTVRPPIAVLTVCDDGKLEGEVIRIRDHKFVIGRTEGDLRIPLDGRMSAKHVEITHQVVGGLHRWVVTDLQSTHGLFVRVSKTALTDQAEFLVGNGRYRLEIPRTDPDETTDPGVRASDPSGFGDTHAWDDGPGPARLPALTELIGKEIGNRTLLVKNEYWIGSDPACPICRADDPFCEPHHVRVYKSSKGHWSVEHNKTQNGLWLRMPQIKVESVVQFQIGEQRFRLRVH